MAKGAWRSVLAKIAPGLGTVLGGPLGGIAGKVLGDILTPGVAKPSESDLEAAFATATPEQLLELKQADQEFTEKMKALDVDIFKLEITDKASARSLYAINYWPQIILSMAFITGYFTIVILLLTGQVVVPEALKDVLVALIAIMSASVTAIMGFWFGSSFGSREKTAALAASSPADGGR